MKRCTKCILPENYPGITFNKEGICNLCINHKERKYLGGEALKREIVTFLETKKDRNDYYDCVLGLSGGRDSSFLLYYLVKLLNLEVLAYSVDHGFIPKQTKQNMKNMTDILNVKLVIEEHNYLKNCIKHHILSWMHRPSPAMIGMLCTGCRFGMDIGILNFAKNNNIPVIIMGGTAFEDASYKYDIMKINPNSKNFTSFILGFLLHIMRNPKWILNSTCLITQIKEFYFHYYRKILNRKKDILKIEPFDSYIRWRENEVISTIENELKWKKHPHTESTWRGDCDIALLKLYLYKKTIGFNDKDDGLSSLIRDGQVNREEALERLKAEGEIPERVIKKIFNKLGLKYSYLEAALRKTQINQNL